jgi:N-acetylmuramoyl-L-alanine amidase
VRLKRETVGLVLLAALAAGCHTARVEKLAVTEVTLPETQPFVLPRRETNPPPPQVVVTPPVTPVPAPPTAPVNGWVSLENWCQANAPCKARKLGAERLSVTTRQGVAVFEAGSQVMRWDGLCVWLGFAPRNVHGQLHVHALDMQKTFEPLLLGPPPLAKPGRVIVIDPGHGGSDGGTQGSRTQLEKDFTLDWAHRVAAILRTNGWQVILTRVSDADVSLSQRVAIAESVGADLFVSLHFNGLASDSRHSGIETFCTTPLGMPSSVKRNGEDNPALEHPGNAFDRDSLRVAARLHRELLATTRASDGGVRRARFITVLRAQHRPAVLIEGGFLSNPAEAGRIATAAYRQKLAEAVARALL